MKKASLYAVGGVTDPGEIAKAVSPETIIASIKALSAIDRMYDHDREGEAGDLLVALGEGLTADEITRARATLVSLVAYQAARDGEIDPRVFGNL